MSNIQHNILALRQSLSDTIVGQQALLDRLVIGLLCGGHVLVEGLPGLAKTTAVKALAQGIHAPFKRIQFTPDLLPGDLTGTDIYDPRSADFHFLPGPLFNDIILADEINRAPAKVQAALLEAMQERQITVGGQTRALPELFMVMATQNPVEQAGTYPLPQAPLDRFMLHVKLGYPSADEEIDILRRDRERALGQSGGQPAPAVLTVSAADVLAARAEVQRVHVSPLIEAYVVALVRATREPGAFRPEWAGVLQNGASPRASLALVKTAAAWAWLQGRDFVAPQDLQALAPDVLRHRMELGLEARLQGLDRDVLLQGLIAAVPAP